MRPWSDIVGPQHVGPGAAADAVDGLLPAWVVRPGSVAEVQACVRAAAGKGAAVVASGLGAHLDVGARPRRLDVLLRTDRLSRVVDHQPGDMTVTVEGGCSLAALAAALDRAGQWLPLDPPRPEATTVGGLIAADLSGPLRAAEGTARDHLLGLRFVGADGALVTGGGRVVKNVAGYDLPKLHVGALGTLGVLVEATFKVRPRPEREEAVMIACDGVGRAGEVALAVLEQGPGPLWLEVAGPGVVAGCAAVAVGLGGIAEEVAHGRAALLALGRGAGVEGTVVADGQALRSRLGAFAARPAVAVLRAGVLPSEVGAAMEMMDGLPVVAHAANGIVRAAAATVSDAERLVRTLRPRLESGGGWLVVERALPEAKAALEVWGDPGPAAALMRGIKEAFDPAGVFAPGRFVGGL